MADAISYDESVWVMEIDPTDPETLSSVSVDYTPAFNFGSCFKDNFSVYLKYLALLDPQEADALILSYYCDKKVKEIAKILRTTAVKVSGLIHQAEQRLALILHINILLSESVASELLKQLTNEFERRVFTTYLREISRRRTAHVTGKTFHQVSAVIRKIMENLNQVEHSHECRALLDLITPIITPPRETRQLDHSERISVFDIITCPQEPCPTPSGEITYSLGCFAKCGSNQDIISTIPVSTMHVAYVSVNQAILVQQGSAHSWESITPPYVSKLVRQSLFHPVISVPQKPFAKKKVARESKKPPTVPLRPVRKKSKAPLVPKATKASKKTVETPLLETIATPKVSVT